MSNQALIKKMKDMPAHDVDRAQGATIQFLLGPDDKMPHFHLRRFTLEPEGHIPMHLHPDIEHEQLVLEGQMELTLGDQVKTVKAGDVVYIPSGLAHAYHNKGDKPVRFLCAVPVSEAYETIWLDNRE